jgi:hypothetical protein
MRYNAHLLSILNLINQLGTRGSIHTVRRQRSGSIYERGRVGDPVQRLLITNAKYMLHLTRIHNIKEDSHYR